MELTFTREEIPKIVRAGGSGREAEPWESHLAPLKETPNESFRVWTYDKRTSATSRMTSVRDRLTKAVPHENWNLAVRQLPNSEQFGVWIEFRGTYTPEEMVDNRRKHDERSARVKAARAKNTPAVEESPNGGESPLEAPTPKERVQAANRRKAS